MPVVTTGRRGLRAAAFTAFLVLQLVVFWACVAAGRPTLYALFMPLSAAAVALLGRRGAFQVIAAALGGVLLIGLALPVLLFVSRQDPGLVAQKAADPDVHHALYLAVYAPLLAALVSTGLGTPLALCLRQPFPGRALVESLVDLPLVIPHSVAGLMVLFAFGKGGAFPGMTMLGTITGMVIAMVFVSAPYAINAARQAFDAIPPRLERAARVHGARPLATFVRVLLPLARRHIVIGGVLAWARAVSEFGAVAIVSYSVRMFYPFTGQTVTAQHAPVLVYNTFISEGLPQSGAVGLLLLGVSAAIFLIVRWLTGGRSTGSLL